MIDRIFEDVNEVIIKQIIKSLPAQCSKVFLLSRFKCLNNNEIAAQLGLSGIQLKFKSSELLRK